MKREGKVSLLSAAALSFSIAFGGLECMVTAFSLEASLSGIALYCLLFSLVAAKVVAMKQGCRILSILLLPVFLLFWFPGKLDDHLESLVYQLSVWYDSAYGIGTFHWGEEPPRGMAVGLALCAIGTVVILVCAWTVVTRKPAYFAVGVGILPLCTCLVVTDKVPSNGSLFFLITGLLLLILTQTVRRQKAVDGNRLTAILLIPAMLCTALLFWAVPRDGYESQVSLPQWIQDLFAGDLPDIGGFVGTTDTSVDLSNVGPKSRATYVVMEVQTDRGGLLYLRGQAYDHYDGLGWTVSIHAAQEDTCWPDRGMTAWGQVAIKPRGNADIRYFPYYPGASVQSQIRFGKLPGSGTNEAYSFEIYEPVTDRTLSLGATQKELVTECLNLPDSTKTRAKEILRNIGMIGSLSDKKKASLIADYVSGLAEYDLNTQRMPRNEDDFALWFIEKGDTGYCVHFATAAVVLLRAAGVPARYVTGFMTTVGSGGWANVIARESHAWVEYLDSERGWVLLDPTPPEPDPDPSVPTGPDPTGSEPTRPSEPDNTEHTEATDPSAPTVPPQTTVPGGTPTNSTSISTSGGADTPMQRDLTLFWRCMNILVSMILAAVVLWGQYVLRWSYRRRRMRRGDANRQALTRWKEIVRMSRILKESLPEELAELAEKAKFSQHILTQGELKEFKLHQKRLSQILQRKPWYRQLLLRLVFAVR